MELYCYSTYFSADTLFCFSNWSQRRECIIPPMQTISVPNSQNVRSIKLGQTHLNLCFAILLTLLKNQKDDRPKMSLLHFFYQSWSRFCILGAIHAVVDRFWPEPIAHANNLLSRSWTPFPHGQLNLCCLIVSNSKLSICCRYSILNQR